jgi:hypothetical protein
MSNITSFPPGRSFQFLVKGRATFSPSTQWVSSFWAYSIGSGGLIDLQALASSLRTFVRDMCNNYVEIGDVRVSSGAHDGNPYDPNTFMVLDFPWEPGLRGGGQGDNMAAQAVLWISRAVATGRQGNLYLRGVLQEGDVWAQAGQWTLTNAAAIATLLADSIADSGMNSYFLNGGNQVLRLALITTTGAFVRSLLGMSVKGVNIMKLGHRYFDRGPATVGPGGHTELPDAETVLAENAELASLANSWQPTVDTSGDQPEP